MINQLKAENPCDLKLWFACFNHHLSIYEKRNYGPYIMTTFSMTIFVIIILSFHPGQNCS